MRLKGKQNKQKNKKQKNRMLFFSIILLERNFLHKMCLFTCHAVAKSCPTLSDTITMDENLEYIFPCDQDHLSTIPMEDFNGPYSCYSSLSHSLL